ASKPVGSSAKSPNGSMRAACRSVSGGAIFVTHVIVRRGDGVPYLPIRARRGNRITAICAFEQGGAGLGARSVAGGAGLVFAVSTVLQFGCAVAPELGCQWVRDSRLVRCCNYYGVHLDLGDIRA